MEEYIFTLCCLYVLVLQVTTRKKNTHLLLNYLCVCMYIYLPTQRLIGAHASFSGFMELYLNLSNPLQTPSLELNRSLSGWKSLFN